MGGAPPHGPYGAPRAPRGAGAPPMGPMGPQGPQRGLRGGRPGRGEPPGRSQARAESGPGGVRPGGGPQPWADLCQRAKIRVRPRIFGRKKIVEIWPIWTHGEHRKACPVFSVKRHGVKNSALLMSYRRLKLARKKNGPNVPGSQCRPEPGPGGGTGRGLPRGRTAPGMDCPGAGLPRGWTAPGLDCPGAGPPWGWTAPGLSSPGPVQALACPGPGPDQARA